MSQCIECKHYIKNDNGIYKCKAFPDGIPADLMLNKILHTKNVEEDNGYLFESKYEDPAE